MKLRGKKLFNIMIVVALAYVGGALAGDALDLREQASRQAAAQLLKQLGGALKKEMSTGGPEAAISVCRDLAPQISGAISRANGWRMTRVSNRVRNPLLGMPDAWELNALSEFEKRAGQGDGQPRPRLPEHRATAGRRKQRQQTGRQQLLHVETLHDHLDDPVGFA